MSGDDKRVSFDFEVDFSNGGGIQGQGFRLDIDGDDIDDAALAAYIVRDLRLLMVGAVRILNKTIIRERHKRAAAASDANTDASNTAASSTAATAAMFELSHTIEHGMITYRGLPAPIVCDFLSREASRAHYAEGTQFQIGHIAMCSNTGTYVDVPFHRYADGEDLADVGVARLADLPGVVVRVTGMSGRAIDREAFMASDVRGKAVLVHTGWAAHWRTDRYFEGHPHLTAAAAEYLVAQGARLVGIDSLNIDDTSGGERPVHTILLGAGIPIVEHLRGLEQLPESGFRFTAAPPKVRGMGTFTVRAFAVV